MPSVSYEKTSIPLIEKLLEVNYDLEDWKEAIICNKMVVDYFNKEGNEIKYVQSLNNLAFWREKARTWRNPTKHLQKQSAYIMC